MENNLHFFTHDRLDLVVKYRFFKGLEEGHMPADEEQMYAKHILARTRGVEPGNSRKRNIDTYVAAARDLFQSMKVAGFDKNKPIPVDQWGRLRDGAHRLACATVLGLDVELRYLNKKHPIRQWGIDWFLANGFSKQYVNSLLDDLNIITGYPNQAGIKRAPKTDKRLFV